MRLAFSFFVSGLLCWMLATSALAAPPDGASDEQYLFTSFRGNGEDGLHLALSTDGYHWQALNHDRSFLRPTIGAKLMRDPCLAEGPDGTFHMVWTSGWTTEQGHVIGYANSRDLVHWSDQRGIALMQQEPAARNIWAPEIFWDQGRQRWLIFWSSTVPGKFTATADTGDDGYNHRFYYATTRDFVDVSPSQLFYDPGFNCIDATLLRDGERVILVFKDERKQPLKKNLRLAFATDPQGPFEALSDPLTQAWMEGPSAIKIGQYYFVYCDHYAAPQYYGAYRSKDLRSWEDCSQAMEFPPGHRHGTVVRISSQLAQSLRELK